MSRKREKREKWETAYAGDVQNGGGAARTNGSYGAYGAYGSLAQGGVHNVHNVHKVHDVHITKTHYASRVSKMSGMVDLLALKNDLRLDKIRKDIILYPARLKI